MKTKTVHLTNSERLLVLKHVNKMIADFSVKQTSVKSQVTCYGLRDKLRASK